MIQCVGSRSPEHQYCSRTCCGEAVKNAITLKELNPGAQVFILYRDIRTYGLKEIYYKKARDLGVQFVRFEPDRKPEVAATAAGPHGVGLRPVACRQPWPFRPITWSCPRPSGLIR